MSSSPTLKEEFGPIDIYVFDQILRGNIAPGMRILDAGCGSGRNLLYLLRAGYEVQAIDADKESIELVRGLAAALAPHLPSENFRTGSIERMHLPDNSVDYVICNAVLHFANHEQHFRAMVQELWRVLRPGGIFFARLGSRIGMQFEHIRNDVYRVGDGTEWFLVDESLLLAITAQLNGSLVDPLKTTIVQNQRCMTTWVMRKAAEYFLSPGKSERLEA